MKDVIEDRAAVADDPAGGTGLPEIRFVRPIPGLGELRRFVLVRTDPDQGGSGEPAAAEAGGGDAAGLVDVSSGLLYELRSIEQPEIRFLVAVPSAFFPEYTVELDDATCTELGLTSDHDGNADDALVLVILTVGADVASTTANLMAPVVINGRTRTAAQVILSGTDWPIRAALG